MNVTHYSGNIKLYSRIINKDIFTICVNRVWSQSLGAATAVSTFVNESWLVLLVLVGAKDPGELVGRLPALSELVDFCQAQPKLQLN